ncbi:MULTISPECIES: 3'(2'),5'-bisphosphate nucleotidase CysQ [Pseudovibrio]|uniref:3'(2'),5'-bisphosphate nucleotidase CysQ n=1 Tax=Stappiaceae TaxID=2821832 RepID=UPI002365FDC1|nr:MULTISPECIES: 3'(2'),5'-bisphosphate nucleotidase CysQ [Pseudovibrio]MDD7911314.1 3'(2'),5'-bisphosphate nucleotidase CysQ [Pseudovibrio exalbescens]MDX5592999.1 3'(2'),5'-bisphosphate nucleotidase CysQ [Pseudovibrio sp. SPO723]
MQEADNENLEDLELLVDCAREGGKIALKYFGNNPRSWLKAGDSPVSVADIEVDQFLSRELRDARPDYGWLSEETEDDLSRLDHARIFVVDPIDGTGAFLGGQTEWCLSLAVVENQRPSVGVIYCPVRDELITAVTGGGAFLNGDKIKASNLGSLEGAKVAGPKTLLDSEEAKASGLIYAPYIRSLAYRFAMVAAGRLDAGTARARARDWDLAAADRILTEAGGQLVDMNGNALLYNKSTTKHPALVASARGLFNKLQVMATTH